jgi:hypothetical protein
MLRRLRVRALSCRRESMAGGTRHCDELSPNRALHQAHRGFGYPAAGLGSGARVTNLLPLAATIIVPVGALGSLVLMLQAGRVQNSWILLILYTLWVLLPSAALVATSASSRRWPIPARAILDATKLLLALASFTVYCGRCLWLPPPEGRIHIPSCSPGFLAGHRDRCSVQVAFGP